MRISDPEQDTLHSENEPLEFESLFKENFKQLHAYAVTFLQDTDSAEEIVQTVFLKLWERRESLRIHTSARAYLYKSVYHHCLNHLKHRQVRMKYIKEQKNVSLGHSYEPAGTSDRELKQALSEALNSLPEKCRLVFQLSRFEDLKYHEIAGKLGISIKTVEGQMGKALRVLRQKLADYLPVIVLISLTA